MPRRCSPRAGDAERPRGEPARGGENARGAGGDPAAPRHVTSTAPFDGGVLGISVMFSGRIISVQGFFGGVSVVFRVFLWRFNSVYKF